MCNVILYEFFFHFVFFFWKKKQNSSQKYRHCPSMGKIKIETKKIYSCLAMLVRYLLNMSLNVILCQCNIKANIWHCYLHRQTVNKVQCCRSLIQYLMLNGEERKKKTSIQYVPSNNGLCRVFFAVCEIFEILVEWFK